MILRQPDPVKTVLVVDDDPGLQEMLQALLEFEGYRTVVARDGVEALERIAAESPDLILLDLIMPRMDGYAFAAELGRRGLRTDLPLIVLTAAGRVEERARQLGADDFVAKPFDVDILLEKVARLLAPG